MRFRKLRIAWSVTCGIACVLLIVLWVRSANLYDHAQSRLFGLQKIALGSGGGCLSTSVYFGEVGEFAESVGSSRLNKLPPGAVSSPWAFGKSSGGYPSLGSAAAVQYYVSMPHWFPILLVAVLGMAPWLQRQFRLRTLLIATTLVAVVLGFAVYTMRN